MNNKIIISLICFAIVLALIFFIIIPFWSSIKILETNISELGQETIEIENLLAKGQQLERKYLESEEQAQKVILALPQEKDISYLLVQFEGFALQNGLLLEEINFSSTNEEGKTSRQKTVQQSFLKTEQNELPEGVSILSVDIKINGSYEALKGYLDSLENNVRSMDIYQISVKLPEEKEDGYFDELGIFEFTLGIEVYYRPSV